MFDHYLNFDMYDVVVDPPSTPSNYCFYCKEAVTKLNPDYYRCSQPIMYGFQSFWFVNLRRKHNFPSSTKRKYDIFSTFAVLELKSKIIT